MANLDQAEMSSSIEESKLVRLQKIRARIDSACRQANRKTEHVKLLAVSKTKPWQDIQEFLNLGQLNFGENYIQEALPKIQVLELIQPKPEWHFLGHLQSNKAKYIPGKFALFHGLDSIKLAQQLQNSAAKINTKLSALVEVNLEGELTKGGVAVSELPYFLESLRKFSALNIQGLMCIPSPSSQRKDPRRAFSTLRNLMELVNNAGAYSQKLVELSMGMSGDFESAILEGSTIVRIGTLLFGERT